MMRLMLLNLMSSLTTYLSLCSLTTLHLTQSLIPSLTLHTNILSQSLITNRKSITHNPSHTCIRNLPIPTHSLSLTIILSLTTIHNLSPISHSQRILLTLTTHNHPTNN